MPRRGLRVWVAPLMRQAKFFKEGRKRFLYLDAETRVSSERFRGADLERTRSLLAEQRKRSWLQPSGAFFPGANLFTVKFSRTRYMRTCDWTEA